MLSVSITAMSVVPAVRLYNVTKEKWQHFLKTLSLNTSETMYKLGFKNVSWVTRLQVYSSKYNRKQPPRCIVIRLLHPVAEMVTTTYLCSVKTNVS